MASRPASGNWARAVQYIQGDQKEMSNVFWFAPTGSFGSTWNMATFAGAVNTYLAAAVTPPVSNNFNFRGCYVEVKNGTLVTGIDYYLTAAGGTNSDPNPGDVAVVVQKHTTQPGPSMRGRWYFPGATDSNTDGSYLNNSGITAWSTLATALAQPFTDQSITWKPQHFSPASATITPIQYCNVVALL
ncbi:MAG: hypothetical protein WBZ11_09430, partial [Candidatus Sulfotelmatobacter sp.]